jgi:hypothetical protein
VPGAAEIVSASRTAALVTAWHAGISMCLLDLVACRSVALDGAPIQVAFRLSEVVFELVTRRWCDLDELVLVGFGRDIFRLDRVIYLRDAEEATRHLLASDTPKRGAARCVVMAPSLGGSLAESTPYTLASLVELVHVLPTTGLLCCDASLPSVKAIWRVADSPWIGNVVIRQSFGRHLVLGPAEAAGRHAACVIAAELPAPLPASSNGAHHSRGARPDAAADEAPRQVRIGVLGPVEISGTLGCLDRRPRVSELIVYLAFHRGGCSGEAIKTALWPKRMPRQQTVSNRLSEARRAVGKGVDGRSRIRRVSGRHVLLREVTTDWEDFERLTGDGTEESAWCEALRLIRGRPFDGLSEGDWVSLEGLSTSIERCIGEVACRVAQAASLRGDMGRAEWAVCRGQLAAPWDEELLRCLMQIRFKSGNRGGVDAAVQTFCRALGWEGHPLDGVHPDTARLYRQLMGEHHDGWPRSRPT